MTQREKTLAGAIVGLLALWGLWRGYESYTQSYDSRSRELARLDKQLFDEQLEGKKARRALRRLAAYQELSLPADPEVAQSAYRTWLIDTVKSSGLTLANVKSAPSRQRVGEAADALTFDLTASGSPAGIARLLDAYYRLDALHKITTLTLTPSDPEGKAWGVTLRSVALSVEGSDTGGRLPAEPADPSRLVGATVDAYAESFSGRNVFARYTPPKPEPPRVVEKKAAPKKTPPDDAERARLTGVVETGSGLQAWVHVGSTGETLHLGEGDPFEVGRMRGEVLAVKRRELWLTLDGGQTWRVTLGQSLREGQAEVAPADDA